MSVGQKRLAVYFEFSFSAGNCVSFTSLKSTIKQEIEQTDGTMQMESDGLNKNLKYCFCRLSRIVKHVDVIEKRN